MNDHNVRVQLNLSVPAWFKDGLQQLADLQSKEKDHNVPMVDLVMQCVQDKYPQILELKKRGGFVSKLISSSKAKAVTA